MQITPYKNIVASVPQSGPCMTVMMADGMVRILPLNTTRYVLRNRSPLYPCSEGYDGGNKCGMSLSSKDTTLEIPGVMIEPAGDLCYDRKMW